MQRVVGALRSASWSAHHRQLVDHRAHVLDRATTCSTGCLSASLATSPVSSTMAVVAGDADVAAVADGSRMRGARLAARWPGRRAARPRCGGRSTTIAPPTTAPPISSGAQAGSSAVAASRAAPSGARTMAGESVGVVMWFSCSPSSCTSTASHRQCSTSRCTSWMRAVRSCGTQMWTSVSRQHRRAILPPLRPVSATTVMSLACAASIGGEHVGGVAAGAHRQQHVAGLAERLAPAWRRCASKP